MEKSLVEESLLEKSLVEESLMEEPNWQGRGVSPPWNSGENSLPPQVVELLYRRGIGSQAEMEDWVQASFRSLKSPWSLKGMDRAVQRLVEARDKGEKICIYGDYDMDGTPGVALALKALGALGFGPLTYFQPDRFQDGYGFHHQKLKDFHREGVQVVLTVDVGITGWKACERARELGIDVIITDHHLPLEKLPEALAIVNPNQGDCPSGLHHLCGTGVVFYLCLALKNYLERDPQWKPPGRVMDPKQWLDCFAIATLTDRVPLLGENRILVKHGLLALQNTKHLGLKKLLGALELNHRDLWAQDVAYKLAPKLNALSRMGHSVRALELFLVENPNRAETLVDLVLAVNRERKECQNQAEAWALESAKKFASRDFIFLWKKGLHPGVLGLVATKLSQVFEKPSFVASENQEGQLLGSARAPEFWSGNLVQILESCSSCLSKFGGHRLAAGFELPLEKAPSLLQELEGRALPASPRLPRRVLTYDFALEIGDLTPAFMNWIQALEPFGQDFEFPQFLFQSVRIQSLKKLRGGHFKLGLHQGGHQLEGLLFRPQESDSHGKLVESLRPGLYIDCIGEPQWNFFAGRKSLQLLLKDLKPSSKT